MVLISTHRLMKAHKRFGLISTKTPSGKDTAAISNPTTIQFYPMLHQPANPSGFRALQSIPQLQLTSLPLSSKFLTKFLQSPDVHRMLVLLIRHFPLPKLLSRVLQNQRIENRHLKRILPLPLCNLNRDILLDRRVPADDLSTLSPSEANLELLGIDPASQSPYSSTRSTIRSLTLPPHPIFDIPPSPPGSPPPSTAKIAHFLELKRQGTHFNARLADSVALRNPELLGKLMEFAGISQEDSYASTLSEEEGLGVLSEWPEDGYADFLQRSQTEICDRRDEAVRKAGRERVEFVGAASTSASAPSSAPAAASTAVGTGANPGSTTGAAGAGGLVASARRPASGAPSRTSTPGSTDSRGVARGGGRERRRSRSRSRSPRR
ncbi:hypothetical protein H2201_002506 [Coniosporium apollinis]|uniref:Uncharacterized protein n=1 Tax=Coniosporium apollinis TaxID=61459 RepID=A0ABQ9NY50_9PEZI|nr:hypothetical protein H2201_002506 [Coniosporium apollinis]